MKPRTIARLVGGAIILFNLWVIGEYRIEGVMVLVLTFGVAIAFELLIVRSFADGDGPQQRPEAPAPVAPSSSIHPTSKAPADELPSKAVLTEEHWEKALKEFEAPGRRAGLWGMSFAEANGDEARAKAKYLQVRAAELAQADWEAAQESARVAEAKRLAEEEAARLAAQREYDAKPKGICPSCKKVILLDAVKCPHCHATFGKDAAWHVLHPGET
jgi:hypothetical protein